MRMMNFNGFPKALACALFDTAWIASPSLHAQSVPSTLEEISFAGDIHQSMPGVGGAVTGSDDDIFVFNRSTGASSTFNFIGVQPHAGIDGYAASPATCPVVEYYSLDSMAEISFLIGGVKTILPADVFSRVSVSLNAKAAGVPDGVNVDAVSIDPVTCNLVISIDVIAKLGGTVYKPDDLIRWNGTAFSLYRTLNFGVNIDALHIISPTRFLYSIDADGMVPGMFAQDDDVIEYIAGGPGSFQVLAFSPRLVDSSWIAADLVGLSGRVIYYYRIFADGFE